MELHSFGPKGELLAPFHEMCDHAWGRNSVPPPERKELPSCPPLQPAVSSLANWALWLLLSISPCAIEDRRRSEGCYFLGNPSPPFSITTNKASKRDQPLPGHAGGEQRLPPFLPQMKSVLATQTRLMNVGAAGGECNQVREPEL